MQQKIVSAYRERFGGEPLVVFAPGRINLIGEHVDYNDGYVMPAAIDKGIWFAIAPNQSDELRCFSFDMQEMITVSLSEVSKRSGWSNYILGVVHVMMLEGHRLGGFNCVFGGNLPVGAGLSSSAAVECGLAFGLNEIFGLNQGRRQLAIMSQRAEHLYPGVNCGIMDQYASLMGLKDSIMMLDCRSIEHQYIPFMLQRHSLVLINSRVQHSLAGGEYNIRRSQCAEGLAFLAQKDHSVKSFRDVSPDLLESSRDTMDQTIYNRCSYVVSEIERTRQASEYLTADNFEGFGELMYATHRGLSSLYEVSCAELDYLVDRAKEEGVTGSRLMGGGFGGCTLNLVENDRLDQTVNAITDSYLAAFGIAADVLQVKVSEGVHVVARGLPV